MLHHDKQWQQSPPQEPEVRKKYGTSRQCGTSPWTLADISNAIDPIVQIDDSDVENAYCGAARLKACSYLPRGRASHVAAFDYHK